MGGVKKMSLRFRTLVVNRAISAWALLLLACSQPSATDKQHLHLLQQRFGQKVDLALEGDLYLKARLRDPGQAPDAELREIYRAFVLDDDGRRRETPVVYLNVYDSEGASKNSSLTTSLASNSWRVGPNTISGAGLTFPSPE